VPLNPFHNPRVRFAWCLPQKAVGLAAENFRSHVRNAVNENRGLRDVIGTNYIAIADNHEVGTATSPSRRVASQLLRASTSRRTLPGPTGRWTDAQNDVQCEPIILLERRRSCFPGVPRQVDRGNSATNTSVELSAEHVYSAYDVTVAALMPIRVGIRIAVQTAKKI